MERHRIVQLFPHNTDNVKIAFDFKPTAPYFLQDAHLTLKGETVK